MQIFFLAAALLAAPASSAAAPAKEITVYAAASLREVVTDVAAEYERRTGTKVHTEFDASSSLARRIQAGAPVDVYLSADLDWMQQVKPRESFAWLRNRLVCVTAPGAKADCKNAKTLILGGEQVPVGKYARAALVKIGAKPAERIVNGANVRDVLRKVAQGAGDAGVVYQTDAVLEPSLPVAFVFPEDSHPPIIAPAGRLTDAGKGFYEALQSDWALAVAKQKGFSPAK